MENYATILLVEDDESLAQWVAEYLDNQGYTTHICHRGDQAVAMVKDVSPDIVLLDIMLPGQDGISVCRDLRQFYNKPIVMMTAKDEEMDEVIGLEVGASDYVIKPVRPRALLARIKSLLRSSEQNTSTSEADNDNIQVGTLHIDTLARKVTVDGTEIAISSAEYLLLHFLASNAGEVVSRDAVFKATKGREYDGLDRRFDVMISTLRKKLNDDPQNPTRIKTVWGKGYLFSSTAWD